VKVLALKVGTLTMPDAEVPVFTLGSGHVFAELGLADPEARPSHQGCPICSRGGSMAKVQHSDQEITEATQHRVIQHGVIQHGVQVNVNETSLLAALGGCSNAWLMSGLRGIAWRGIAWRGIARRSSP
jgi:hypothetical protein